MYGLKCYVANGVATTDKRYNADGSLSDQFRAKGKKSYDVIFFMGRAIGYSQALIEEDIDSYQTLLSAAFVRDDTFFQRTRSECIKIGLM